MTDKPEATYDLETAVQLCNDAIQYGDLGSIAKAFQELCATAKSLENENAELRANNADLFAQMEHEAGRAKAGASLAARYIEDANKLKFEIDGLKKREDMLNNTVSELRIVIDAHNIEKEAYLGFMRGLRLLLGTLDEKVGGENE